MNGGIPQMKRKNEQSTRELMGTKELSDYSIRTYRKDELVYFLIQPRNQPDCAETAGTGCRTP